MPQSLLIATNNAGKVAELRSLLAEVSVEVVGLDAFPDVDEVAETGATFIENARLKAIGYAAQTGLFALADDSGLEVLALDGRPGVRSARYGGEGTSFAQKIDLLLEEIVSTGDVERRARFVCAMAIASPELQILHTSEGICGGLIAQNKSGTGGFGYDPIFVPDGFEMTFGELSGEIKQEISHRKRAFLQIIPFLRDFMAN